MKQDITLPIELFDARFSLEEIGTLALIMSYPYQDNKIIEFWNKHKPYTDVINSFIERKIIIFDGDKMEIDIDADKKIEPSKNMNINNAIKELYENCDLSNDVLIYVKDLMEEIASSSYTTGYEDGKIDFQEIPLNSYSKKEDIQ